jgi:hypothetical protein
VLAGWLSDPYLCMIRTERKKVAIKVLSEKDHGGRNFWRRMKNNLDRSSRGLSNGSQ